MREMLGLDMVGEPGELHRFAVLDGGAPVTEIDAPLLDDHAPGTPDRSNPQIQIEGLTEAIGLTGHLIQQSAGGTIAYF